MMVREIPEERQAESEAAMIDALQQVMSQLETLPQRSNLSWLKTCNAGWQSRNGNGDYIPNGPKSLPRSQRALAAEKPLG